MDLLFKALVHVLSNQEAIMADLATLQAAVQNVSTQVQALEQKMQNAPPSVLQTDLDPIVADLTNLASSIEALVNPQA